MCKIKRCLLLVLAALLLPAFAGASNFYLFPDSNKRRLTHQEVWAWQYDALGYAFNELFARYGRPFEKGGKYDNYFQCQTWYREDPYYPGDGPVLSNLEWDNYVLIKDVREEMRQRGTTNPKGKALPEVFDDRISSPLSGFDEMYFKPNQKLKVYDGPGAYYRRGANGKAVASTNGRVYVAGWESGWLMVMYEVNKGGVRIGFASPGDFRGSDINAPQLWFEYLPTVTLKEGQLTEDPVKALTPIGRLPRGTSVTWLTRFYARGDAWDYVEADYNGQTVRGFLRMGVVDLGFQDDPMVNK
jgi:hypothetical protein